MKAVTIDDVPEEYHFWHAMMGLGLTVGRDVSLVDNPEVYANLFVCLLGMTGSGKSKAKRYLSNVMHEAAPWDNNQKEPLGVKMIPTPASAEASNQSLPEGFSHHRRVWQGNQGLCVRQRVR